MTINMTSYFPVISIRCMKFEHSCIYDAPKLQREFLNS